MDKVQRGEQPDDCKPLASVGAGVEEIRLWGEQPRVNDLLRGRVSRFSLDALVNIATALGKRVQIRLDAA